ncbi:MAG TPA: valine--tRNA ligase [Oligoflexia bacterium]|nr:valine--tRNA ligase [Oligoflexia bacterium]HMR23754.1 valine--tRNA ligase [Oligoflexia bacterium]
MGSSTRHSGKDDTRRNQQINQRLDTRYQPESFEQQLYQDSLDQALFKANANSSKDAFTIVIPPPNVTGVLHMGHALDNTLQDILIRYKRMDGYEALWLPGTDHAGIATQAVVERNLLAEGTSRQKIGRKAFVDRVWQWKEQSGNTIINQLKRLGASCDWSRERFTLDEGLSYAVRKVFVDLYNEGLIYRSSYLVNWSPALQSAISDLEVNHEEVDGQLVYFKYPLADHASEHIVVATTRPETILGDTAIAVHPNDSRYQNLIGKTVVHPFVNRTIPIIADEYVDPKFGSGAVKITPAHDPNDYEMGKRHNLDNITILDKSGHIDCPESDFHTQDRFEARKNIIQSLKDKNLWLKTEPHRHSVGICDRSGAVVEPRISEQWFVKTKPLAEPALAAVKSSDVKFVPSQWTKTYEHWMENIQDWCISRQLWWGHQIPVWYCDNCSEKTVTIDDPDYCQHCQSKNIQQDPDVLDTWFSSGLWPFSTLGWPESTDDLKKFFPTSVLVTGFDIIFFWVARMMMMSCKFMGQAPFHTIHIHALVKDEQGKKMSKSKGNVVDPLELMNTYGTDAFRFSLTAFAAQGRDILLSEKRIEGYRNFMTKLWNAARFTLSQLSEDKVFTSDELNQTSPQTMAQHWILNELETLIDEVRKALDQYRFNEAAQATYNFIWKNYCDWFLEVAKADLDEPQLKNKTQLVLVHALETSLRLLHPIAPFITDKIWQELPLEQSTTYHAIGWQSYPKALKNKALENQKVHDFQTTQNIIEAIRQFRAENQIAPSQQINKVYIPDFNQLINKSNIDESKRYIQRLCRVEFIENSNLPEDIRKQAHSSIKIAHTQSTLTVPWQGIIDINKELDRLQKNLLKANKEKESVEKRLNNKSFVDKAPKDVLEKNKLRLQEAIQQIKQIEQELHRLDHA